MTGKDAARSEFAWKGQGCAAFTPDGKELIVSDAGETRKAAKGTGTRVTNHTTLHVLDMYGRAPVQLDLGDTTDAYPVPVAWLPDGSAVVVLVVSRDCRR